MKKEEKYTNHIRRFLHSTKAKGTSAGTILLIVIIVAALVYGYGQGWFSNINLPFGVQSGGGGKEDVNRALAFTLTDTYAGSALTSKTLLVYDASGAQVESIATDGTTGIAHTAHTYASGTQLYVKYVTGNTKQWFNVVVPQMYKSEEQASTYNPVALDSFAVGTGSLAIRAAGSAVTSEYNGTTSGMTPIFTVELTNTGSDNTGMMDSYDPVYGQAWQLWIVVTISGTNYQTVTYSGFSQAWTLATTYYGANQLSSDMFTKWKVGSNYKPGYQGDQSTTFSIDLSGYPATSDTVTMNVYAYAYCDPAYAQAHGGNFGAAKVQLDTVAVTLKN
jgi:hypothetical protein